MSKKQWGHGYHEGRTDAACVAHDARFENEKLLDRLRAQLVLLSEYQVGERGFNDPVYLGLINALYLIDKTFRGYRDENAPTSES